MYATPALGLDGELILLNQPCRGDGSENVSCGLPLRFSHDDIDGDTLHRYGSCIDRHTWAFTGPSVQPPIKAKKYGKLIDDSDGGSGPAGKIIVSIDPRGRDYGEVESTIQEALGDLSSEVRFMDARS